MFLFVKCILQFSIFCQKCYIVFLTRVVGAKIVESSPPIGSVCCVFSKDLLKMAMSTGSGVLFGCIMLGMVGMVCDVWLLFYIRMYW